MKQVKALSDGFYNGSLVPKGTVFSIPAEQKLGAWMEAVAEEKSLPNKPTKKGKGEDNDLA